MQFARRNFKVPRQYWNLGNMKRVRQQILAVSCIEFSVLASTLILTLITAGLADPLTHDEMIFTQKRCSSKTQRHLTA